MRMPIWIRSLLVLLSRHEKLFRNICLAFLRQNQQSLRTLRKTAQTHHFPNIRQRTLLRLCPPSFLRRCTRNLQQTMVPGTTGLQRGDDHSETSMVSIGELQIFGSVPPILMLRRCASRVEESIWVTMSIMS